MMKISTKIKTFIANFALIIIFSLLCCGSKFNSEKYCHNSKRAIKILDNLISECENYPTQRRFKKQLIQSSNEKPIKKVVNISGDLDNQKLIINSKHINDDLMKLIQIYGFKANKNDFSLVKTINIFLQNNFLRQNQKNATNFGNPIERWQLEDSNFDKKNRQKIIYLFKKLGFIEKLNNKKLNVDYYLFFGAKWKTIYNRLKDILEKIKSGSIKCNKIVFLGGIRELTKDEIYDIKKYDKFIIKHTNILTEIGAMKLAWEILADKSLKKTFNINNKRLVIVNDKNICDENNFRSTTKSTILAWLENDKLLNKKLITIHGTVEKPYGPRMYLTLKRVLRQYFEAHPISYVEKIKISWNSASVNPKIKISILKDEIARNFYEEFLLFTAPPTSFFKEAS